MAAKKFYIRIGTIPRSGRSRIGAAYRTLRQRFGSVPEFERGISVYEAAFDPAHNKWVIPAYYIDSYLLGLCDLLIEAVCGRRKIYLVTGRRVRDAEGSDGEPLLRDVKIIKELSPTEVYNSEAWEDPDNCMELKDDE